MFDQSKLDQLKGQTGGEVQLTQKELRKLRSEIDKLLPKNSLNSLDLEVELVDQYFKTKDLMDEISGDEATPANQKAQVANSVVNTLGQLVKLQQDLKREHTLKIMEGCLIDAVKVLPEAVKTEFFSEYERIAKKAGLM